MSATTLHMVPTAPSANQVHMGDLLRRTAGGAARVLSRGKNWILGMIAKARNVPGVGFVMRATSKAWTILKAILTSPVSLWAGLNLATTGKGREIIGSIVSPVIGVAKFLGKLVLNVVRTPLSWFGVQRIIDTPLAWVVEKVAAAKKFLTTKVTKHFAPGSTQMRALNVATTVGLTLSIFAMPLAFFGWAAIYAKGAFALFAGANVLNQGYELARPYLPAAVTTRVDKVTNRQASPVKLAFVSTSPVVEGVAIKTQSDIDREQDLLLQDIGHVEYAKLVITEEVPYSEAIMSKTAAKRILREAKINSKIPAKV